jgi:NTP pyrophosphatase (non-canonical NTP hydrolase)
MRKQMDTIKKLIEEIISFRDERDWKQFHNTKDLAIALSIEASELNEILLWKNNESIDKNKLSEELADVFIYAFLIAEKHDLDIKEIILEKLALNAKKYPINKSLGKADKYNEL